MISVADAIRLVLADLQPTGVEQVPVPASVGRVLAGPVRSGRNVPPFRNSAMDGYAVRAGDVAAATAGQPVRLRLLEVVAAGEQPRAAVTPGTATQVMTGSPVPEGADAVVRIEDVQAADAEGIVVGRPVAAGANIREAGEDVRMGDDVLEAGRVLRAPDVGLLASIGLATVRVRRRPEVAIVTTGSELVDLGQAPGPGQIANSNAYTLGAAVTEAGGVPRLLGIVPDDAAALRAAFTDALTSDLVLSTGGVSVGAFDLVRGILDDLGVVERFWKVAQRPGKPLLFGRRGSTPVFGLPGNPVSAPVCFSLYVRPALRAMLGDPAPHLRVATATLESDVGSVAGLTEFIPVVLSEAGGTLRARPTGPRGSGILRSLSLADGLLVGPPEATLLPAGSAGRVILLGPGSSPHPPV